MKEIRREQGFIQIDETNYQRVRFCNYKNDGLYSYDWIIIDNEKYLFKKGTISSCISEVFWSYVLNYLKVKNVQYDLAEHDNLYGVITKDYNPNKLKVKSIYQVEKDYEDIILKEMGIKIRRNLHNIQDLKKIYLKLYSEYGDFCVEKLKKDTYLKFVLQILLGDMDCHARNTEIWFFEYPEVAPFYDFGRYGRLKLRGSLDDYALKYMCEQEDEWNKPDWVFNTFLKNATSKEIEVFKEYMNKIREINRRELFEEMEDTIQNRIPLLLKVNLENKLLRNTKKAEKILKRAA